MIPIRKNHHRRGMLAVALLVCLLIVIAIAGTLIRAATAQRDEARAIERRLQAEWLAEAGLHRAIARLAADPKYPGETWNLEPSDLDAPDGASVTITIDSDATHPTIRAQADYPRDPPRRARCTREMRLDHRPG